MMTHTSIASRHDELIRWCYTVAADLRWYGVLLSLLALALLVSFYQVVSGSMHDSQQRLKLAALHDKASVRCKALGVLPARDQCFSVITVSANRNTQPRRTETIGEPTLMAGL